MKSSVAGALVALAAAAAACGGDSSGGVVAPPPPAVEAAFVATEPSPDDHTVSMASGESDWDEVVVRVVVTGQEDVWGAAFDVKFDPNNVEFAGYSAGDLLEQSGEDVNYTVREPEEDSGLVVVGVSLTGLAPAVSVTTTRTLVNLTFRVRERGSFPLAFKDGAALLNSSLDSIADLTSPWPAGDLQGS